MKPQADGPCMTPVMTAKRLSDRRRACPISESKPSLRKKSDLLTSSASASLILSHLRPWSNAP